MLTGLTLDLPQQPTLPPRRGDALGDRVAYLEEQLSALFEEHVRMLQGVRTAFDTLNREGALRIADATIDGSAIGSNTPSTGAFTTLSATGLVNLSGAAAGQIKFPATQNASADANTFDDYQVLDWTPVLKFGGSSVGITYGTQTGKLRKFADGGVASFRITLTNKGAQVGAATITGFTYTASPICPWAVGAVQNLAAGITAPIIELSGSTIFLFKDAAVNSGTMTDADFTNTTEIIGAGVFLV